MFKLFNLRKKEKEEINFNDYKIKFYDTPEYVWVVSKEDITISADAKKYSLKEVIQEVEEEILRRKFKVKERFLNENTKIDKEINELKEELKVIKGTIEKENLISRISLLESKYKRY